MREGDLPGHARPRSRSAWPCSVSGRPLDGGGTMTDVDPRAQAADVGQREEVSMATDPNGRAGSSTGAMAKDLGVSPAKVKRALSDLGIEPDFVQAGCAYYYTERSAAVKKALAKS